MLRTGIDLGGSKIEIASFGDDHCMLWRERVPTPRGDYLGTVMAIAGLVEQAEQKFGARTTVGVGIPGAESRVTGLVKNANSTCLNGNPLKRDLQAVLQREVRIANDANCFALSEAVDGAAAGVPVVFGVILGTGVGGGIVVDGKVLAGANAIAGEWGHNYLAPDPDSADGHAVPADPGRKAPAATEPACYCGRRSCVETWLSGPGLAADHQRATGSERTAEEIARGASAGDADCESTLQRYEARLARALGAVINILDPDAVVLGGGLSNIDRLYENVPRLWAAQVFSDHVATRLLKHRHGDSSGVRGAAWLWN